MISYRNRISQSQNGNIQNSYNCRSHCFT